MKRLSRFLGVIIIIIWTSITAQTVSLDDAIELALKNQPGIQAEKAGVKSADFLKRKAFGRFLPSIEMSVNYTHLKEDLILDLNPIREGILQLHAQGEVTHSNLANLITYGVPLTPEQQQAVYAGAYQQLDALFPAFSETLKKQNYWQGHVQVFQPLFTWGKIWSAYKIASIDHEISKTKLSLKEQQVISEVVQAYFLNQFLSQLVEVRTKAVETLETHERHAKRMAEEGLIAKVEYLRTSTALEKAKVELDKTQNDLAVAQQFLANKIGIDHITFTDPIAFPGYVPKLDSLLRDLDLNQPYLKQLSMTSQKLRKKIHIDLSNNLPDIYAFGKYELFKDDLSILEPEWAVGIGLKWDIFSGFQKYHQIRSDKYLKKKVDLTRQELKNDLVVLIKKTYSEMENAKRHYHAMQKTKELAMENFKLNSKKFDTGLGTSLEVLDAELTLRQVEIALLKDIYDYNSKLAELLVLTGNAHQIRDWF
ncbi:MAG: TolC family protein [Calditrichia bacterium]